MPQVSDDYIKNRKKMIVQAAFRVFSKKGYSSTSMKDIMEEANISRGGLYAYFENIDAIFIAVLIYDDFLKSDLLTNFDLDKAILPQLNDWIFNTINTINDKNGNLVKAKSEFFLAHDIKNYPYLQKRHDDLLEMTKDLIDIGIKQDEFKKDTDKESFCELLICMMDGIMLHQYNKELSDASFKVLLTIMSKMIESYLT